MDFHHLQDGCPEQEWVSDGRWADLRRLTVTAGRGIRRLVLLAAHPDDETLGAGGLLGSCARAGIPIDVLIASDGEASHPDSPTHSPADLARLRRVEVAAAVSTLAPAADVQYLALPDGALSDRTVAVAQSLRRCVADVGVGAIIAAPWRHDGHPDHDALGLTAALVAEETGALLLEYPIWWWHRGSPIHTPWPDLVLLDLAPDDRAAKRQALRAHTTQVQPLSDAAGDEVLLSAGMLAHFERPFETFIDVAGAAHEEIFERLHTREIDPWRVRSSDYERCKRELTMSMLPVTRFARAYEPGCSVGELSAALAVRCDALISQDLSRTAVQAARVRLASWSHVDVRQGALPGDWPEGDFDLVVLSEVGYFLSATELGEVLRRTRMTLRPNGYVVLCHWARAIDGWELDGQAVHALAAELLDLPVQGRHVDAELLLEVFGPCP